MNKTSKPRTSSDFVAVATKSYGSKLKGIKIYYEGKKPKQLRADGSIKFGKHILEALGARLGNRFRWIITKDTDSITQAYGVWRVRTSTRLLDKMNGESFDRSRDIKNDIVKRFFSRTYPSYFTADNTSVYVPGTLASLLRDDISSKLSSEDREAVQRFLPVFLAEESIKSVNLLKAAAQIRSLRQLAAEFEVAIPANHGESWWQTFIREKILIIQQGYIQAIEKMNITVGNTKFPDFSLVTHDSYLDILEIKKPDTRLLRPDESRGNFYADAEIARAIAQVENYIENIGKQADAVRSYILDTYHLDLKVVRPRGIILAGNATLFKTQKEKDDFRLLAQGLKNVTILTYDELLTRLKNYIKVLEDSSTPSIRGRESHPETNEV